MSIFTRTVPDQYYAMTSRLTNGGHQRTTMRVVAGCILVLGLPAMLAAAPPEMQDYIATMPIWASIGWALGIWGSFAGSVLMLLRLRWAVQAFLVSLLGALLSFAGQARAGVLEPAQPAVILIVIGFLLWFCRRAERSGVLR